LGFRDLLAFLTTLPVGAGSLEGAARSYWAAPAVGLIVGVAAAGAGLLGAVAGGPALGAALYILVHVALTGGLHLDGVADVGDVLHSGARGGDAARILRDPRKGAGAVIAVATILLVQYGAAQALLASPRHGALALAVGHVFSYTAMVAASKVFPPSPYTGLGRLFATLGLEGWRFPAGIALGLALAGPALAYEPFVASCEGVATVLGGLAVGWLAVSRIGYANGDVLGMVQEAGRAAGLVGAGLCMLV